MNWIFTYQGRNLLCCHEKPFSFGKMVILFDFIVHLFTCSASPLKKTFVRVDQKCNFSNSILRECKQTSRSWLFSLLI